ncbi:MAG: tetratricopeptide repeat protein [Thermodesulfobacteriota bacterium]|nr:tetratricopeptide repeat protein [Thermodesulfobacteriota bacterium]
MKLRKAYFYFLLFLILVPGLRIHTTFAQENNLSVSVQAFQNRGKDDKDGWLGIGLIEYLRLSLNELTTITLINDVPPGKPTSPTKRLSDMKILEIGKALDTDMLVWGSFEIRREKVTITGMVTDAKSGMTTEFAKQKGKLDAILNLQENLLQELLFVLNVSLEKEGMERIKSLMPQSSLTYEHYLRGRYCLLKKKDYSNALVEFNKAITLEPDFPLAWAFIGETYLLLANSGNGKGMLKKAEEASLRALVTISDLVVARENLAIICFRLKDLVRAKRELQKAISLNPINAQTRFLLGTICLRQKEFGKAINEFEQVGKIDPHYPRLHHNLCMAYYEIKSLDLAKEEGFLVLQENPPDPEIHFILGNIYFELENWDKAVAEYQMVEQIDSCYPDIHYYLAMAYHRGGNLEDAIAEYQKAIDAGNVRQACLNRGMIHYHGGNFPSAKKDFQSFLESNPACKKTSCLAHNCLAAIYHQEGRFESARKQYEKALDLNPQFSEAHYRLGTIYHHQDKYLGAIREYREALQLNPDYKEAHFNLALVFEKSQEYLRAINHFKQFISLASSSDEKLIKAAEEQIRLLTGFQQ